MSPRSKVLTLAFLTLSGITPPLAAQEPAPESVETLMDRDQTIAPEVVDNVQRVDPGFDGWRSEVLHDGAKQGFKAFFAWAVYQEEFPTESIAQDFHCPPLRPIDLSLLYQDGQLSIRHAEHPHGETLGLDDQENMVSGLRSLLAEPVASNTFFKITTVRVGQNQQFETDFIFHGASGTRLPVQVNLEGTATWQIGATDEEVQLAKIHIHQYEEVLATRTTFADVTAGVFQGDKLWNLLMLHDTQDFTKRTDRVIGQSYIGSQGVAVGDIDNDGLDDVFVPMPGGSPNRLYRHMPDGTAEEISAKAQVDWVDNTRAALFLDVDNDGDQDLVISVGANLVIGYNDGNGVFSERVPLRKLDEPHIYSLSAADYDQDGDLDIYACRYVAGGLIGGAPAPYHDANNGADNFLWRNEGNREWKDVTAEVGLDKGNSKFSLASVWADFDQDGDLDLYVANDFGRNNLYINDGKGHFQDEAVERGADDIGAAMGASVADVDGDGDQDILVTNMFSSAGRRIATQSNRFMDGQSQEVHQDYIRHARGNTLLINQGNGHFTDATEEAGIAVGGWAWGARFVDINNNGRPDIYSPNGFLTNRKTKDL
jgi:hypothetical protein